MKATLIGEIGYCCSKLSSFLMTRIAFESVAKCWFEIYF